MNILIIDSQGGGIGKQVVEAVKRNFPNADVTAVGTNSIASSVMLKAGADRAGTGENAVKVCCRSADVIIGPVGIVIADAMLGEITPEIARAVGSSSAKRFLIPVNQCDNVIMGVPDLSIGKLVQCVITELKKLSGD